MANKVLKSLTFPGLNDVYKIPQEADEYSTSATYAVGDYCIKDGVLYRCTTAITTAEAWTAGHWTATQLADEVTSQSEKIEEVEGIVDDLIIISPSEPSSEDNKIWIDSSADSVQVPTMADLNLIKNAALIRKSANGAIASFSDGADGLQIRNITLDNNATTLSRRGKNLFDKTDSNQKIVQSYLSDNVISYAADRLCVTIPCKPNTTYTVSRKRVSTSERMAISYAKTSVKPKVGDSVYGKVSATSAGTVGDIFSATITTGEDATYIVVWAYWDSATSAINDLQIELGPYATNYTAFDGKDYTVNSGEPTEQVTTLLGANVFWADIGNVSIDYYADTTLVLEALQQQ